MGLKPFSGRFLSTHCTWSSFGNPDHDIHIPTNDPYQGPSWVSKETKNIKKQNRNEGVTLQPRKHTQNTHLMRDGQWRTKALHLQHIPVKNKTFTALFGHCLLDCYKNTTSPKTLEGKLKAIYTDNTVNQKEQYSPNGVHI